MTNHNPADAIKKLLPHAEARQEFLYLLAENNPAAYQGHYEDCRHDISYAYEALNTPVPAAQSPPAVNLTRICLLPPDPEGMNDDRAKWAGAAVRQFQSETGSEFEDALADLLADLMHLADRTALDFDDELARARMHYEAETTPEDPILPPADPALIAAASTMFEALEKAESELERMEAATGQRTDAGVILAIRAAIAKAQNRGTQHDAA